MSKERNRAIAVMLAATVAIVVFAVAMFIGLNSNGSTEKMTADDMSVGEDHMLAIDAGGNVYAWGHNIKGELGDVTCDNKSAPVKIEVPGTAVQVEAGNELSFARCKNGDLYAWGDNSSYQMGDGMNISRMEPEKMMENVAMVAAGSYHAMAIDTDGVLYVWGRNKNGALGIADSECDQTDENGYPCMSLPYKLMEDVVYIDAGEDYSMAITSDGTLYAWGYDADSQLGIEKTDSVNDNGEAYQSKPAKVMEGVSKSACGSKYMAFALTESGELYAWGNASVGSLGTEKIDDPENQVQVTPLKVMDEVQDIAAGSAHAVALKTDGTAYTWGVNNYCQLGMKYGDSTYTIGEETIYYQTKPRKLAKNVEAIDAGGFNTIYRSSDGVLRSVGSNLYGQLGIGSETDSVKTPTAVYLKK